MNLYKNATAIAALTPDVVQNNKEGDALVLPFFVPEHEQQAKDFIWNSLPDKTKQFLIDVALMTVEERQRLYVNKAVLSHIEGEIKGNRIVKEIAMLSLQ